MREYELEVRDMDRELHERSKWALKPEGTSELEGQIWWAKEKIRSLREERREFDQVLEEEWTQTPEEESQ